MLLYSHLQLVMQDMLTLAEQLLTSWTLAVALCVFVRCPGILEESKSNFIVKFVDTIWSQTSYV